MKRPLFLHYLVLIFFLASLLAGALSAAPAMQAGAYRVEIETDPPIIPVGKAKLRLRVLDSDGQPVTGATVRTLTKMPGMAMGEREETAKPMSNMAGTYESAASFPMGGGYEVDVKISGARGKADGTISLQTGQSTAGSGAASSTLRSWLLPIGLLLLVVFIVWRMRRNGQKINWRAGLHWQTAAGVAVLLGMLWAGRYAVNNWRRPGSMTPLEAQGMEMSMPAPVGATAVELATVRLNPLRSTVRYTGQAVGLNEQEVYARVTGNLIWMPFYTGDQVRRGQLLARLDRSQIEPQIASQRAARAMAEQGANVARNEYEASMANVRQQEASWRVRIAALAEAHQQERRMRAQIGSRVAQVAQARAEERKSRAGAVNKRGGVLEAGSGERRARATLREAATQLRGARGAQAEAQSDIAVAREERINAESDLSAAQTLVPDAQAEVSAAQADVEAETQEIARQRVLVAEGLVARRDLERQTARVEAARSRVKQTQVRVIQAQAGVRGAQSRIRRAEAAIRGAEAKERQADAAMEGAQARQEAARADITAAQARVQQSRAEVEGAGADIGGARARVQQMQADVQAAREEAAAAAATVQKAQAELEEGLGAVRTAQAQAQAVRGRIGQAQAGVTQAEANVSQATTTAGYTEIRSLLDGVVTQRLISPGTLVNSGQAILKVAQINPIRLQANVAESDLKRLRVGGFITVRDRDNKEKPLTARLSSVAPAVDAQTRTGIVEAIVPNPDRRFSPGEYVSMEIATGESLVPLSVPTVAVQQRATMNAGTTSSYVWVAEPAQAETAQAGQFTVRPVSVKIGISDGTSTEIRSGLKPGQRVVTLGFQDLSEGDTVTTSQSDLSPVSSESSTRFSSSQTEKFRTAAIAVTDKGFEPATVTLQAGAPVRLTFTRKTDATCATEVVFPDFNIKKALPLNQAVIIEFTPKKTGALNYACGMDMLRGKVVVRP